MKRGAPLNPFSARFHRPGALPYRFREGESAKTLWRRFLDAGRRGAIVGPHGTGKTTLLRSLEPVARSAGEAVHVVTLHDGQRWPPELLEGVRAPCPPLAAVLGARASSPTHRRTLFLDGAEQLAPAAWLALRLWTRVRGIGLLVATHRPLGLQTLHTTLVDAETALWVAKSIVERHPSLPLLVRAECVEAALARKNGNLREALFHLYDVYEDRWNIHAGCDSNRAHTST